MSNEVNLSIEADLSKFTSEQIKATAFTMYSSLIKATPVDTGRAKANWQISFDTPETGTTEDIDKTRKGGISTKSLSRGAAVLDGNKQKYPTVWISNNLPYILVLNEGTSTQAPAKFVESAIKRSLNRAIKKFG